MAKRPTDKTMLDYLEANGTFDVFRVREQDAAKNGDRWRWRPARDGAAAHPSRDVKSAPTLRAALAAAMAADGVREDRK